MACSKHNGPCRAHLFQLRSLQPNSTGLPAVQVDFCPSANSAVSSGQDILPMFNRDGKYYTAGFLLPCDQHYIQQNDIFEKDRFDRGVASKLNSSTSLLVPQPSNNNRHCFCCRLDYQDYLLVSTQVIQHIRSEQHRQSVSVSLGNRYIQDLAREYTEQQPVTIKPLAACDPEKRCSRRLQESYEKKKEKEPSVGDVSTMTSQKNAKFEEGCYPTKGRLRIIGRRKRQPRKTSRAN